VIPVEREIPESLSRLLSRYENARFRIVEIPVVREIFDYFNSERWIRVVAVVKSDDGVVMIRKPVTVRDNEGKLREHVGGEWMLAGGKPEEGEEYEETAVREVKEETGLDVEVERLLGVYVFRFKCGGQAADAVLVAFSTRAVGGKLRAGREVQEVRAFKEIRRSDLVYVPDWWYGFHAEMLEDAGVTLTE